MSRLIMSRLMSEPVVGARDLARVPGRPRVAEGVRRVEGLGRGFDMRFNKGEE